ncbi:MAG: DUF1638 domain-containing protein [Opitutaceae bacterium]|nr:DUF1638 domain-containing protein [Opitutaceae bacterium]
MKNNRKRERLGIITCGVLEDEVKVLLETLPGVEGVTVLEQGLHDQPLVLREELQKAVDRMEEETEAEAIVLVYGLCSRGTEEVSTKRCRLVITRGHDCLTILLGSRKRYADYMKKNPGTYWYSPGWNKWRKAPGKERFEKMRAEYTEKYGEEDADYLMEMEQEWMSAYNRATFVDLGLAVNPEDIEYTKECAEFLDCDFRHEKGDPTLLHDLLAGNWDEGRFLVLEPGEALKGNAKESVVEATACQSCLQKSKC